jgi:diaminopimelate decarboxylase
VTLSANIRSVLSSATPRVLGAANRHDSLGDAVVAEPETLRRCQTYRKGLPTAEIAMPASALRSRMVSAWVRDKGLTVDVGTSEELRLVIAAGIQPRRVTVDADQVDTGELCRMAALGVGRVVVSSIEQINRLARGDVRPTQSVLVRMDAIDANRTAEAVTAVLAHNRLSLVGLHGDVGSAVNDFISYPAAIGNLIGEMDQVRREHRLVLTRLGLGGSRAVPTGDWSIELPKLAGDIDDSLDDACGAWRYPRPVVILSPGPAIVAERPA